MRESTYPRRCLPATCKLLRKLTTILAGCSYCKTWSRRLLPVLHGRNKARFSLDNAVKLREEALRWCQKLHTFLKYICNKFRYTIFRLMFPIEKFKSRLKFDYIVHEIQTQIRKTDYGVLCNSGFQLAFQTNGKSKSKPDFRNNVKLI